MANLLTKQELANIIGTWHPRGFHGHTRSKSRIEFSDVYRQSAKPSPPEKFRNRLKEDALKHTFSNHDNKQVFLNDPLLFGSGVGKRKIDSVNKNRWNPEFMTWCEDAGRDRFKRTVYQKDYCINPNNSKLLIGRKTIDNRPISVYSCNYGHGEPSPENAKETQKDTYYRFVNKHRAKSSVGERITVASCMVWADRIKVDPKPEPTKTEQSPPPLPPPQVETQ